MKVIEKLICACVLPAALAFSIPACSAGNLDKAPTATNSPCPQAEDETPIDDSQVCTRWSAEALENSASLIREEKLTQAERLLVSFRATSPDVEAERLYHLYSIAKLRWDHESMVKIADQATTRTRGTHYAALIAGIEECIRGTCESAISDLEYANSSINNPTARGYLAAAYAYAGRHKDAEPLVDQIRPLAASVDDLLLYISVGTYLSVGRRQDAESFAADFFSANGPPESFGEKQAAGLLSQP